MNSDCFREGVNRFTSLFEHNERVDVELMILAVVFRKILAFLPPRLLNVIQ